VNDTWHSLIGDTLQLNWSAYVIAYMHWIAHVITYMCWTAYVIAYMCWCVIGFYLYFMPLFQWHLANFCWLLS